MALQSQLFRNDPKLEAAAVSDPAHIAMGATGEHVRKIQLALIQLDGAAIAPDGTYGPATAAAVLAYKQKRNIVNRSYQTMADNIVGKMTMAALDGELLAAEALVSGPPRIDALFPVATFTPPRVGPLLAFKFTGPGFRGPQFPPLPGNVEIIPNVPTLFSMELQVGDVGIFQVVNAKGGTVGCLDERIGIVSDRGAPTAPGGTKPVTKDRQDFQVKGLAAGTTIIEAKKPTSPHVNFNVLNIARIQLVVGTKVTAAFHFLGGPKGVATEKLPDLAGALATMNRIYGPQTNITFVNLVNSGGRVVVPEFAQRQPGAGVVLKQSERTADWKAITKFRSDAAIFNVFFVGKLDVADTLFAGAAVALTDTFGKPGFTARDCVVQDDLKKKDLGLVLAHEAGHALGEDDNNVPGELMNVAAPGERIPPQAAARMNATLVKR